jgi:predicted transposase YdaD
MRREARGVNLPNLIDRSLKVLIRRVAPAFFRLAGVSVDPATISPGDVSVNLPEHRADQVFLVGDTTDPSRWALHLEYQLQPDARVLRGWLLKNAALTMQLEVPVILTVVYLAKGDRATFPTCYTATGGGLTNEYRFHTIHLWEHADRIRSGELQELAPLLVLCEDKPTERTLREERKLILDLEAPQPVRAELLAVAAMVGTRYFARSLLERLFQEEMEMLKEVSFIEEWIQEGEARGARLLLLRQLREQFGELPVAAVEHIENLDLAGCEELAVRVLRANSLEELALTENGGPESQATA